jgi:methylmalonyl-CoA mutase N-terminal domain/subunit
MVYGYQRFAGETARLGGLGAPIHAGYPQRRITESADRYQREVERGEKLIVGINAFATEERTPIPTLKIPPEVEPAQRAAVQRLRASRDAGRLKRALDGLRDAACGDGPLMPAILDAARCDATVGEMTSLLKSVFGEYREPAVF